MREQSQLVAQILLSRVGLLTILAIGLLAWPGGSVSADTGTEFPGTVVTVDQATGKFAVKKESGGTRFTFVANDKTKFEGGPKSLKELKQGDHVVVLYQATGPQYIALKVSLKK